MTRKKNKYSTVPLIVFQYWNHIKKMQKNPHKYATDDTRGKLHDELCEYYNLDKEKTKKITGNLDKLNNAIELHFELLGL